MNDAASVSSQTRGRTGKIGEARAISRSSSTDSEASAVCFEPFGQGYGLMDYVQQHVSQADSSEDEYATSASQASAPTGDAPVIRPPIGFQFGNQNQTQGGFGFGAFSQFGPNFASGFYSPAPQQSDPLASTGLALPSRVYGNVAPAFGQMTEQASVATQDPATGWNGFDIPGQPPFDIFGLGTQPQNGAGLSIFPQDPTQQQSFVGPEDVSPQQVPPSNDIMGAFPVNGLPSFEGDLLGENSRASSEHIQDATVEVTSQHVDQGTSDSAAPALQTGPTGEDGGSLDYRAIVESFFAATSNAFPEAGNVADAENLPKPTDPPESNNPPPQPDPHATEDDDIVEIIPEDAPVRSRTVSNDSYAPSDGDDDSDGESRAPTRKKGGRKPAELKSRAKSDGQRRRGKFRVQVTSTASSPQPEPPMSTLPGKPIFTTSDTIINAETPLPYFEYKQRNRAPKQTGTSDGVQHSTGPPGAGTQANSGGGSTGMRTRESSCEPTNANRPAMAQNNAAHLPSPSLPSAGSYAYSSAASPSSQSIGGTPFEGPSLRMHHETEAILASRGTPPENHLVSVMIMDKRIPNGEPSLVELILPLSPSGRSDYWLDTMVFCHALQTGPSRIDGPAKAYTFRGRFRQYFLRVSEHNDDVYGPGNLTVPYNRTVNVTVEPAPPTTIQNLTRQAPVQPLIPSSYANPPGPGLPNGPIPQPTQAQKRPREPSPPSIPAPSTSGTAAAATTNGQQPSKRNYYRERAL